MARTTFETPRWTRSEIRSGVDTGDDCQAAPADDNEQLLSIFSTACAYFEAYGLNHMDAQDLAVETCLRWLAQWHLGRPACRAWLQRVERNLLMDHFRRHGREQRLLASYAEEIRPATGEGHRSKDSCEEILAALPPADREILLGHYVESLKVKELAGRLGLSVNCVKQRLHRAREHLHSQMVEVRSPLLKNSDVSCHLLFTRSV